MVKQTLIIIKKTIVWLFKCFKVLWLFLIYNVNVHQITQYGWCSELNNKIKWCLKSENDIWHVETGNAVESLEDSSNDNSKVSK